MSYIILPRACIRLVISHSDILIGLDAKALCEGSMGRPGTLPIGSLARPDVPGKGNVWSLLPAFRGRRRNVGVTAY